jgi:hypothetical protein
VRRRSSRIQEHPTGGVRANASENSEINPSTIVRAAQGDDSRPHLASVLQEGGKSTNIHVRSGAICWGIPVGSRMYRRSKLAPSHSEIGKAICYSV